MKNEECDIKYDICFALLYLLKHFLYLLASSGWGGGGSPSSPCVDNGTAAWGKPTDAPTGWGDPDDTGKTSGWGDSSPNPVKSGESG